MLKGGVGAALDSTLAHTPGTAGASDSAANSNRETPAAGDVGNHGLEDAMSVGTAGTPNVEVQGDGDVEMT